MSGRDEFDLTRGGEEDESTAIVLSLRRRGRVTPPSGTRPQAGPHRHLVERVQVPPDAGTEPAVRPSTSTLGWNAPPNVPSPTQRAESQPQAIVGWSTRTLLRSAALGAVALVALITTAAVVSSYDQARGPGVPRASANSRRHSTEASGPIVTYLRPVDHSPGRNPGLLTNKTSGARGRARRTRPRAAHHQSVPRSGSGATRTGSTTFVAATSHTYTQPAPAPTPPAVSSETSTPATASTSTSSGQAGPTGQASILGPGSCSCDR